MHNQQLIDDLKETRRQLEVRGRCTGILFEDTGKVCLDGAICAALDIYGYNALSQEPRAREVTLAIATLVKDVPVFGCRTPRTVASGCSDWEKYPAEACYGFNDWTKATDQDVYDVLDKAIAEAGGMG